MAPTRVLVVDDEEDICIFMKDILQRRGFDVVTALSGEQALKLYTEFQPQICFIDVHMPFSEYNGLEVLEKIREKQQNTQCIMITRIDDEKVMKQAQKLNVERYLIKPVTMDQLEKLIQTIKHSVR